MNKVKIKEAFEFTKKLHGAPEAFHIDTNFHLKNAPPFFSSIGDNPRLCLPNIHNIQIAQMHPWEEVSLMLWLSSACQRVRLSLEEVTNGDDALLFRPKFFPQRAIASGGACYPTELYFCFSPKWDCFSEEASSYIFKYSPNYHALVAHRSKNGEMFPVFYDKSSPDIQIFLNVKFERSSTKYKSFAYRLTAVDTGFLLGKIITVLKEFECEIRVDFDFPGKKIDNFLDINHPDEGVYVIISLFNFFNKENSHKKIDIKKINFDNKKFNDKNNYSANIPIELLEMHKFSHDTFLSNETSKKLTTRPRKNYGKSNFSLLIHASENRGSLANYFIDSPSSKKILLLCINNAIKTLEDMDFFNLKSDLPPLKLYCAVFNVSEFKCGLYRFDKEKRKLILLDDKPNKEEIFDCLHLKSANIMLSSFIVHVVGPLDWRQTARGPRQYRIQQMLAGVAMEAITLVANQAGLSAHPYLGFNGKKLKDLYKTLSADEEILSQICIGKPNHNFIYTPIMP